MPECGLPDELLERTDVLIWWGHVAHDKVPDELVGKIRERVLKGMGFIPLHSAHPSKPMQALLGTSGSLKWREDDFCRVWNINPTHPIAQGIPESFELPGEEMYGEPFGIRSRTISCSWGGSGAGKCSAAAVPGPGATARFSTSSRAMRPVPPITIRWF